MDKCRDLVRLIALAVAFALVGSVGALFDPPATKAIQSFWSDYNDDGEGDLAIGIPGERIGGNANAGAVQVIYGHNPDGFGTANQDFFHENNLEATDGPSQGDRFGAALASADFDDDGFSDLAIGIPGEDIGGTSMGIDRGAIVILWGSENGLAEDPNVAIETGPNRNFGSALATIDMFNPAINQGNQADAIGDLVVADDRAVSFFVGGSRNFLNVPTTPRRLNVRGSDSLTSFRMVLAAGKLDADFPDELIVGMPDKANAGIAGAGQIAVVDHITPANGTEFDVDFVGQEQLDFVSKANDNFGAAVAIGQLIGEDTSVEEVLIGTPGRDVTFNGSSRNDAGVVYLPILGTASVLSEASTGVPDDPEAGDRFGAALLINGFSTTGGLGIAIGVPGEQLGSVDGAGAVIISETAAGGSGTHRYLLSQNTTGVPGTAAAGDNFGATLASSDYDGVGAADLAIGVPNDNPTDVNNAGSVNVIYHDQTQLAGRTGDRLWSQATTGIPGTTQTNDKFGAALN